MEQTEHPEIAEVDWIDDAFYIRKTRFGLFTSVRKDTGKDFLTGATFSRLFLI